MIKVFTAGGSDPFRLGGSRGRLAVVLGLCVAFPLFSESASGQAANAGGAVQKPGAAEPSKDAAAKKDEDEKAADAPVLDPSETQQGVAVELFLDPNAAALMDLKNFKPIRVSHDATNSEFDQFKRMAADPLVQPDQAVIIAVVDSMIAKLTNPKNIEAVLDVSGAGANAAASKAIQDATKTLIEPIFQARAVKNTQFQTVYNRVLAQKLPPVLKNHLIPRIQAMIVLGESGSLDAYKTFLDEIKDPTQTVWVKHWAFKGLSNIKEHTNKLSATQEADAAKLIADQLVKNEEWPWPVQFRALETLATLRQGYSPTSARTADMAAAAFQYLTNGDLDLEVRAEAALALGFMQITSVVPKYNNTVIAYATAELAAEIGDRIAERFTENKLRAQKYTTVLMKPILQTYEGRPGFRESGLLNSPVTANKADIQKYDDAIRPVVKAAIDLVGGPVGQVKANLEALKARIAVLKAFLDKNPPPTRELFQGGPQLPEPAAPVAAEPKAAPAEPKAAQPAPETAKAPQPAAEKAKSDRPRVSSGRSRGKQ